MSRPGALVIALSAGATLAALIALALAMPLAALSIMVGWFLATVAIGAMLLYTP